MSSTFSERLVERRQLSGLNRKDFAATVGISEAQIWRYEKGESEPNISTLIKICEVLNASADWLLGMVPGEVVVHPTEKRMIVQTPIIGAYTRFQQLDNVEAEMLRVFRTKNAEQRQKIIDIAKLL